MKIRRSHKATLRRRLGLAATLLLIVAVSVFTLKGSWAWLTSSADKTNVFTPGNVTTEIEEEFDHETKKDVKVKNTGNTDAYIRVALVPGWKIGNGDLSAREIKDTDYAMDLNLTDWFKAGDYYYYKYEVAPEGLTTNLINLFEILVYEPGLDFELQVIGSGIQSQPADAVESSWTAVQVSNGELVPAGGGGGNP